MKDTESALKWVVGILNDKNIPFQIGGGFAARLYGVNRPLADIDIALPTNLLSNVFEEVKEYITYDLRGFKDEKWDVMGMTIVYKGQEIDFVGAQGKKIFNEKEGKWIDLENDFSKTETKEIYGIKVPVVPKDYLIYYKSILQRQVDKEDLKGLGVEL